MQHITLAQWYVSDNICALCDSERHLAHVANVRGLWFVFDATHPNNNELGCRLLGTFARKLTAMEAAESELLGHHDLLTYGGSLVPDTKRFRALSPVDVHDSPRPLKAVPRRA